MSVSKPKSAWMPGDWMSVSITATLRPEAAINAATNDLPPDLPRRPFYRKFNPADAPVMTLALSSDSVPTARIFDAVDTVLAQRLSQLPGVAQVQTGIAVQVTLDVPGLAEPAVGLINSLPERGEPVLNLPYIRSGVLPRAGVSTRELAVSEAFADARSLRPGDSISAVLNGSKQPFRLTAVVLSPEFVFEAPPGAALPENRTYGVFWMPYKELATAFQMYGAFNQVSVRLAPGATAGAVIADLDRLLAPYGGRGAYGREDHPSNRRLDDEMRQLQGLAVAFPLIFLSVAAFMSHSVMNRQITLQREQIAMLKA